MPGTSSRFVVTSVAHGVHCRVRLETIVAREYPEFLTHMGAHLAAFLEGAGLPADQAGEVAFRYTEQFRHDYGKEEIYIPAATYLDLPEKYGAVFEDWRDGITDYAELGRKHGYSRQWIGQIIRAERLARRQPVETRPLFEEAG